MATPDSDFLMPGFNFYYVSDQVKGDVLPQVKDSRTQHAMVVKTGTRPYDMAGAAGSWLARNKVSNITGLYLVGHGGPGSVRIGEQLTARNITPVAGWLQSFLDPSCVVRILGCQAAADRADKVGIYWMGQMLPETQYRPGYDLLLTLARASKRPVEGALNGQSMWPLGLKTGCRRVFPNGKQEHFYGGGIRDPI